MYERRNDRSKAARPWIVHALNERLAEGTVQFVSRRPKLFEHAITTAYWSAYV